MDKKEAVFIILGAIWDILKYLINPITIAFCFGIFVACLCGALTTYKTMTTEKYNKVMMRTVQRQQEELTCYKFKRGNCKKKLPKMED